MDVSGDPMQKAEIYHEMGLWEKSEEIFLQIIRDNPNDFLAYYKLGCLQEEVLEYQRAVKYYLDALKLAPDNFNVLYKLAGIAMIGGELNDAAEYYRRCLALNEGSLKANYNLGLICYRRNDWINAAEYFSVAAELGDDYPDIWYMLGMSLKAIGRWNGAIEAMDKAVEISPDRAEIHFNRGNVLLQLLRFEEAEISLNKAVKLDPENSNYLLSLGKLFFRWGKNDEAREKLRQVLEVDRKNETAAMLLNALDGQQVSRVPGELLSSMFDRCSESFDSYMVKELKYCLPGKIKDAVVECCRHYSKVQHFDMVLDLGCGTGLAGEQFSPVCKTLIGVDISLGMIEQATAKNIYQRLICGDLVQVLDSAINKYDLVLAADVFIYIGDLRKTFAAVSRHIVQDGWFAFSAERAEGVDYILSRSGIFAHSPDYIGRLADECGFEMVFKRQSDNESFNNVTIYVLRKK